MTTTRAVRSAAICRKPDANCAMTASSIALCNFGRLKVIVAMPRYIAGDRVDFGAVPLDLGDLGAFRLAVYEAARTVGWGETASYGDLARRIGFPWGARAVGQALARNPVPIIVPCHRILTHDRGIGGFSAYGGTMTKQRLLALEGVQVGMPMLPGLAEPPPA